MDGGTSLEVIVGCFVIALIINIIILLLTRITYKKRFGDQAPYVRYKHPFWFYLILIASLLFPVGSAIIALLMLVIYIARGCGDEADYTIGKRDILNKKI